MFVRFHLLWYSVYTSIYNIISNTRILKFNGHMTDILRRVSFIRQIKSLGFKASPESLISLSMKNNIMDGQDRVCSAAKKTWQGIKSWCVARLSPMPERMTAITDSTWCHFHSKISHAFLQQTSIYSNLRDTPFQFLVMERYNFFAKMIANNFGWKIHCKTIILQIAVVHLSIWNG